MKSILSGLALFRGVSDEDLNDLQQAGNVLELDVNERLIEEGGIPSRVIFLLSGQLEVFIPDPANRSQGKCLARLNSGDSCGEYGFIDRRPASASVKVVEKSKVFYIEINEFDKLLKKKSKPRTSGLSKSTPNFGRQAARQ